jgi:hypothetical protein
MRTRTKTTGWRQGAEIDVDLRRFCLCPTANAIRVSANPRANEYRAVVPVRYDLFDNH